jgi:hypothetical protein
MEVMSFSMNSKNHLRPIRFDTKRADYLGFFLLIIGLIVLGFAIYNSMQISRLLAKTNAGIVNIQNQTMSKQADRDGNDDTEKIEITEKIKKQINYPWEMFFSTLEATHTSNIILMAIQPNIDKKEALISAETANTHLMLDYIRELGKQKSIDHVELLSQEAIADNQQERLSFLIMVKLL